MDFFQIDPSSYILAQNLFIKIIGLSYFFAFWSLSWQVLGLYGSQGIIPAQNVLQSYRSHNTTNKMFFTIPTLFWLNSSDKALKLVAIIGQILSLFVVFGIMPAVWLPFLWIGYLSFANIGVVFLGFQWDALLLEIGLISIFFAIQSPPPLFLLFALWILLFRFMFSSGIVKLLSECPEWCSLKAMRVHYETQPIPNKIAYYAHQQPAWFARFSEVVMFMIEILVPFFIFGNSESRFIACLILIFFQVLIILTGNYAFFNLLTIGLCVTLLDNAHLQWVLGSVQANVVHPNMLISYFLNGVGIFFVLINILQFIAIFGISRRIFQFLNLFRSYYITSSYGLFARMTTIRNEIVVEGSNDGENWSVYEFKWKPGDLSIAPKQVAPYHPRLDWHMWFAALSSYQHNSWFINFLVRLLEGSPTVLKLLKTNPFPDAPPKLIRTLVYEYHFTDLKTKKATGQWWRRKFRGYYTPTIKLE
ncbi:MAG: lipase maturation factor family protein [Parachlamydiaceae bacterium]|nr:lipase maturation factor family protein [Parachlamydiaceae bacterium]